MDGEGAALLLARDVDRPNFGLTLDIGHMIMAGENPAQSAAYFARQVYDSSQSRFTAKTGMSGSQSSNAPCLHELSMQSDFICSNGWPRS